MTTSSLIDNEQPGVLVIVRLIDVIAEYVGCKSEELIKDHTFACKRLYHKYKSMLNGSINYKIEKMKAMEENLITPYAFEYLIKEIVSEKELKSKILMMINIEFETSRDLLIELLVPADKNFEINDLNTKEIIRNYYRLFALKSCEETFDFFIKFVMRGENFSKFKNKKTGLKFIFKAIGDKNYESYKKMLYLNKYEAVSKNFIENKKLVV
jgi:hypothetical protein